LFLFLRISFSDFSFSGFLSAFFCFFFGLSFPDLFMFLFLESRGCVSRVPVFFLLDLSKKENRARSVPAPGLMKSEAVE
jgi:hypothetical protein